MSSASDKARVPATDCQSMADIRAGIDALDVELVDLLAERMDYIHRAAAIKSAEGLPALIPARVAQVIANARQAAVARGLDPDLIERLWQAMIDDAIKAEEALMGRGD